MRDRKQAFSVFQRKDGRWVLSYPDEAGEWRQHSLYGKFANKREAQASAINWLAVKRSDERPTSGQKIISELHEAWIRLRAANPDLASATVRDNDSHMKTWIVPALGHLRLGQLDIPTLRAFVRKVRGEREASTCRNVVKTLTAFFDDGRAEGWVTATTNIVSDPLVRKELPEVERGEVAWMTPEQAQALVDCVKVHGDRRVRYMLAFTTGLRDGEIAGLDWRDADLDADVPVLKIERAFALRAKKADAMSAEAAHAEIRATKTKSSVRMIPLHPATVDALRWWRDEGRERHVPGSGPATPEDPIFTNTRGQRWRPKSAEMLRDDLTTAGLPLVDADGNELVFHSTRSSFATWLEMNGVEEATRQRLMGHLPKSTTSRFYTAAVLAVLTRAVRTISLRWTVGELDNGAAISNLPLLSAPESSCADVVRAAQETSETTAGHLSSVVEQRFRKSEAGAPTTDEGGESGEEPPLLGATSTSPTADRAQAAVRSAQWRAKRVNRRRQRDDEIARLIHEAKDVALGRTGLPAEARPATVHELMRRATVLAGVAEAAS